MMVFIAAQFERSLFKYQDRGYRSVLLEAGRLAHKLNLVAETSLGLGCVLRSGGYFDREADRLLSLNGLTKSSRLHGRHRSPRDATVARRARGFEFTRRRPAVRRSGRQHTATPPRPPCPAPSAAA